MRKGDTTPLALFPVPPFFACGQLRLCLFPLAFSGISEPENARRRHQPASWETPLPYRNTSLPLGCGDPVESYKTLNYPPTPFVFFSSFSPPPDPSRVFTTHSLTRFLFFFLLLGVYPLPFFRALPPSQGFLSQNDCVFCAFSVGHEHASPPFSPPNLAGLTQRSLSILRAFHIHT